MRYLLVFLMFLGSCSADWHLKQAIKKNPKLGDSSVFHKVIIHNDTIHDTIYIPKKDFEFTLNLLDGLMDSLQLVYSDSFIEIYGKLDSANNAKFRGKVKERYIPYTVYIHDTISIEAKCPPNITVVDGYPKSYFWLGLVIFVLIFILWLLKRK
jgi:hypothetical protein